MGTAIAADLARNNNVKIHTSKPHLFNELLMYWDIETGESFESKIALASDNYEDVLKDAEIVFVTVPTQVISYIVEKMLPYINKATAVGFVPGAGGVEFLSARLIAKGCCVFGFERVPYVARLKDYGKLVTASKKAKYRVAVFPKNRKEGLAETISLLFDRPCTEMKSFLSMTLTPTLHTSRLFDLYSNYHEGELLTDNPYFYGDWRDSASEICLKLDDELHEVTDALEKAGMDISDLVPYRIHYESPNVKALTMKLRSITSLKMIKGPVIENPDGSFSLDLDSRYFTESFPFRLAIVKGLSELVGKEVSMTTNVLKWYANLKHKEYFVDGQFVGKDVNECNIPQNKGINTLRALIDFYSSTN